MRVVGGVELKGDRTLACEPGHCYIAIRKIWCRRSLHPESNWLASSSRGRDQVTVYTHICHIPDQTRDDLSYSGANVLLQGEREK